MTSVKFSSAGLKQLPTCLNFPLSVFQTEVEVLIFGRRSFPAAALMGFQAAGAHRLRPPPASCLTAVRDCALGAVGVIATTLAVTQSQREPLQGFGRVAWSDLGFNSALWWLCLEQRAQGPG